MNRIGSFLGLMLALTAPRWVLAQTCVVVDAAKDNLSEADRSGAKTLLEETLRENHETVQEPPCNTTFTVFHVQFGKSINVVMSKGDTTQKARAGTLEEVPQVYSQLVRALLSGQSVDTAGTAMDRTNVTKSQAAPRRALADSLWYVRLGPGAVAGGARDKVGPSFGAGYRYELDRLGIDISFNFLYVQKDSDDDSTDTNVSGSWARLMGLFFLDPTANGSPYLGGGISWGGSTLFKNGDRYSGSGLQGEVALGYEFLRASTIRMFAQAEGTLPFYQAESDTTGKERYTPSFVLSFGLGWGGEGNQVTVHVD
jgi:hypothetical protein